MKICPKCSTEHQKPGTFCSRKCANARVWNDVDKDKKSQSARNSDKVKKANNQKRTLVIKNCKMCDKEFETYSGIYCSNTCRASDPELQKQVNEKLSDIAKLRYKLNPEMHPNRLCAGIHESYPERMVKMFFENNGMIKNIDFIQQYKIDKYHIDFFIPKLNLGIEIDGERWHDLDSLKERIRQNVIESHISLLRFWAKKITKKLHHNDLLEIIDKLKNAT